MSVHGPNNVGRAVQTDPTLLCYASAITEQKKCWELLAEKFDRFQTLRNNFQQHPTTCNRVCQRTQHVTSNNVGSGWPTMLLPFAGGFRWKSKSWKSNDIAIKLGWDSHCRPGFILFWFFRSHSRVPVSLGDHFSHFVRRRWHIDDSSGLGRFSTILPP